MALKNKYSESVSAFDKIQKVLAQHGARKVMFEYDNQGRVEGMSFQLLINNTEMGIRLPARVENVCRVLYGGLLSQSTKSQQEQAYRTAWANIRDWIDAQLALIDTEMVKVEEVFLPYIMQKNGKTIFESIEEKQFLLN